MTSEQAIKFFEVGNIIRTEYSKNYAIIYKIKNGVYYVKWFLKKYDRSFTEYTTLEWAKKINVQAH